jgi:hypothetical protein
MKDHVACLDLPKTHLDVLELLYKRLPPGEYLWALTGSGGLRLQGVNVPVHDLDIQTDEKTIYLIEKQLAEYMITPVMRSLDGRVEISGVEIELLANITHRQADGSWCSYTDFSRLLCIELHGMHIPVFPLEDELEAYLAMGRTEKAALIRKAIREVGK